MSQNQFPQQSQYKDIDPEMIKQLLNRQQQELRLEEIRLQQDGLLAEKLVDMNVHILKNGPAQQRKTVVTYATIGLVVLLVFLTFILYCLMSGKEEFGKTFLIWISHNVMTGIGFWAGRSTAKSKKIDARRIEDIAEAEMVE